MQAAYFYRKRDYLSSYNVYSDLLSAQIRPKVQFLLELLDGLIRNGIKCGKFEKLLELLGKFQQTSTSSDHQFQYWHLAREVYLALGMKSELKRVLVLLLADNVHNAEYWLELSRLGHGENDGKEIQTDLFQTYS